MKPGMAGTGDRRGQRAPEGRVRRGTCSAAAATGNTNQIGQGRAETETEAETDMTDMIDMTGQGQGRDEKRT